MEINHVQIVDIQPQPCPCVATVPLRTSQLSHHDIKTENFKPTPRCTKNPFDSQRLSRIWGSQLSLVKSCTVEITGAHDTGFSISREKESYWQPCPKDDSDSDYDNSFTPPSEAIRSILVGSPRRSAPTILTSSTVWLEAEDCESTDSSTENQKMEESAVRSVMRPIRPLMKGLSCLKEGVGRRPPIFKTEYLSEVYLPHARVRLGSEESISW